MGNVDKILAEVKLNDPLFADMQRLEVCEWVHVHWGDLRILMTPIQFQYFANLLAQSLAEWQRRGGKLSPEKDTLLGTAQMKDPGLFRSEGKVESVNEGKNVHFHYHDVRLEWDIPTFFDTSYLLYKAMNNFFFEMVPLEHINPYDHIHFPTKEQWMQIPGFSAEHLEGDYLNHMEGIKTLKSMIKLGYQIEPILLTLKEDGKYQRRDGFKRFMTYKELGYEVIPSYVVSEEVALNMPQYRMALRGIK
jgi:hypothetical protein